MCDPQSKRANSHAPRVTYSRYGMIAILAVVFAGVADVVFADTAPLGRRVRFSDWNGDIVILLNLVLVVWLYMRGTFAFRNRSQQTAIRLRQSCYFLCGIGITGLCLLSPLDALSAQLATAHMIQHMLLMTVAAPLIVCGAPWSVSVWGLSPATLRGISRIRRRLIGGQVIGRCFTSPVLVWMLYALTTWSWHLPVLYEAALSVEWIHDLQHLCFLATAIIFWRVLLSPRGVVNGNPGLSVVYLFATTLHSMALGVLMTLSPVPWYSHYKITASLWDMTAQQDQQLAGLIMWMPACAPYAVIAAWILLQYFEDEKLLSRPELRGEVF